MIEAAQWKVKWESGLFAREKALASNAMYQEVRRLYLAFMAALWPFLLIKKPQNYRRAILGQLILADRTLG